MKKILAALTAIIAVASLSVSAFAADIDANEQAILDYLKNAKIGDATISESLINQAQNYFAGEGVSVTDADKEKFLADAADLKTFCEDNGVVAGEDGTVDLADLSVLDKAAKDVVLDKASALAQDIDLSIQYSAVSKTVYVFDGNNDKVAEAKTGDIQATGFDGFQGVVAAAGTMLGLVAVSAAITKSRKLDK